MPTSDTLQAGWGAWGLFVAAILGLLVLDLVLLNRKARKISVQEALLFSGIWVLLALLFAWGVFEKAGPKPASQFLAGYLLELSLSVDNLFVFLLLFSAYQVPYRFLHKVLFWGILGAIVLRMIFIGVGSALVERFEWILYLFGAFLIFTGARLLFHEEKHDVSKSLLVRALHRFVPVTEHYDKEGSFFLRRAGRWLATPLFLVLFVVEGSDLLFAVDSIPAVFGVTRDPFIVYTSNVFAILGLRSLFFALEGLIHMFRFLKVGLSIILLLIGLKLCFLHWVEAHLGLGHVEFLVLGAVLLVLLGSVSLSMLFPAKTKARRLSRARG
jgi:tellurite resistance protein TerC